MQTAHSQAPSFATAAGTDGAGTPPPFSPFSTYSSDRSGSALATSDDAPDLGAFAEIFRELDGFRPQGINADQIPRTALDLTPSSSVFVLRSDDELSNSRAFRQFPPPPPTRTVLTPEERQELDDEPLLSPMRTDSDREAARYILHPARPAPRSRFVTEPIHTLASTSTQDTFPTVHSSTTYDTFPSTTALNASSAHTLHPSHHHLPYAPSEPDTAMPTRTLFELLAASARTPRRTSPLSERSDPREEGPYQNGIGSYTENDDAPSSDAPDFSQELSTSEIEKAMFEMDDAEDDAEPSLGYLDEALSFLAAERERVAARIGVSSRSLTRVPTRDHGGEREAEPRRKRRRRKPVSTTNILDSAQLDDGLRAPADDESSSSFDVASSLDVSSPLALLQREAALGGKNLLATPPRNRKERRRLQQKQRQPDQGPSQIQAQALALANTAHENRPPTQLAHSRSTPSLRPVVSIVVDPRVLQLRTLAHKLRLLFPKDAKYLAHVMSLTAPPSNGLLGDAISSFLDSRGPPPGPDDPLVHIFIDHSNILIGMLNYLKRRPHLLPAGRKKHMSHAALALVLERGRPITRRVLATSSPLYQPMDSAEAIGYEVRVYARVPDTGDGADRQRPKHARRTSTAQSGPDGSASDAPATGTGTGTGSGPTTPATTSSHAQALPIRRRHKHTQSFGAPGSAPASAPGVLAGTSPGTTPGGRVKYREQGVDELLQLKVHQALAAAPDPPPPGATIVLATGDGNVGQFNEEGFVGCVRTALRKGWAVELYAWEEGLSRGWKREFGHEERFRVVGLEKFAVDLVEAPEVSPT